MTAGDILYKYGIHKTKIREEILSILLNSKKSLSCGDILRQSQFTHSRNSILRTLKFYHLKGIVHHFMSSEYKLRYYFNESTGNENIYFTCDKCKGSFMFPVKESSIQLSLDHSIEKISYFVSGICADCSETESV